MWHQVDDVATQKSKLGLENARPKIKCFDSVYKIEKVVGPGDQALWTIGVGLRMSTLDSNVAGSIPASICFLLEQETLSALLQSTQL